MKYIYFSKVLIKRMKSKNNFMDYFIDKFNKCNSSITSYIRYLRWFVKESGKKENYEKETIYCFVTLLFFANDFSFFLPFYVQIDSKQVIR